MPDNDLFAIAIVFVIWAGIVLWITRPAPPKPPDCVGSFPWDPEEDRGDLWTCEGCGAVVERDGHTEGCEDCDPDYDDVQRHLEREDEGRESERPYDHGLVYDESEEEELRRKVDAEDAQEARDARDEEEWEDAQDEEDMDTLRGYTRQEEYDHENPPLRDDPMETER